LEQILKVKITKTVRSMKTKLLVISIISAAILLAGASRTNKTAQSQKADSHIVSQGTIGGLAAEDKR
jgi:hypothetical protein